MFTLSHCLTHPRRNRRWTRGAASHAASRGAVAFGALSPGRLVLSGRRRRWCGCGSLPAFLRKREGCRTPGESKDAHGKRGPAPRHGSSKRGAQGRGERGSDARGRARASLMLLQKSTDSDRRREADAPPFHPIWKRSGTGA